MSIPDSMRLPLISWIAQADYPTIQRLLLTQRFNIAVLDGSTIVDGPSFIAQAGRDLPLDPPVLTPHWDAFPDSLYGGIIAAEIDKFALVWLAADVLLDHDPETFVNALQSFTDVAHDLCSPSEQVVVKVILLGVGTSFKEVSL